MSASCLAITARDAPGNMAKLLDAFHSRWVVRVRLDSLVQRERRETTLYECQTLVARPNHARG